VLNALNHNGNGIILNIPATFEFSKEVRVNLNLGAQYYSGGDTPGLFATAGAGISWEFAPQWSTISEVFRESEVKAYDDALNSPGFAWWVSAIEACDGQRASPQSSIAGRACTECVASAGPPAVPARRP
jgi:hypothetical protein